MERHGVTHLQCTPSLAWMLTSDPRARVRLRDLTIMMVGGEAFPPELASDLKELVTGRVLNVYGPTEPTIWSTTHELGPMTSGPVPLGVPIANTLIYILDQHLQPLPAGVPGELVIGGDGVTRGYWNNAGLTAERFVANSFDREPGSRMYRTGDLARWTNDGALEFLGRLDSQVKIRGHRIELGEIEAALSQHPAVDRCVVVAREDHGRDVHLVAYFIANEGVAPALPELRDFLSRSLPDFMVPASFVLLAAFPLTPNGKIDRRALPAPDWDRPELREGFVAPRTATEKKVAQLWGEVLGRERIGLNDDFTELGGDSLAAVSAFARIGQEFQVDFPLYVFFQRPTVARLAAELDRLQAQPDAGVMAVPQSLG